MYIKSGTVFNSILLKCNMRVLVLGCVKWRGACCQLLLVVTHQHRIMNCQMELKEWKCRSDKGRVVSVKAMLLVMYTSQFTYTAVINEPFTTDRRGGCEGEAACSQGYQKLTQSVDSFSVNDLSILSRFTVPDVLKLRETFTSNTQSSKYYKILF